MSTSTAGVQQEGGASEKTLRRMGLSGVGVSWKPFRPLEDHKTTAMRPTLAELLGADHSQPSTNDRIGRAVGHRIIGLNHKAPLWELPTLPLTVKSREGFLVFMFLFLRWLTDMPQSLGSSQTRAVASLPNFLPESPLRLAWCLPDPTKDCMASHLCACLK